MASRVARAQSAAVRLALRLPGWAVPRRAWPTLLAQGATLSPAGAPGSRSVPELVGIATFARSGGDAALARLADHEIAPALRSFVIAAAMRAGDEATIRRVAATESNGAAIAEAAVDAARGSWSHAVELTGSVPRAYSERWIVAATAAGRLSEAIAIGTALRGALPRDSARALGEALDGRAILDGALGGVAHAAIPAPSERRAGAVLYVAAQSMPHRNGGYASRTHGIVTALAASGRDVRVLTRLGFPRDTWPRARRRQSVAPVDVIDSISYYRAGDGPARVPLAPHAAAFASIVEAHARDHGAEVIHAASFPSTALGAALAAKALGVPFVYEVRALEALYRVSESAQFSGSEGEAALMATELAVCDRADAILVITSAIGDALAAAGVPRERITVVGNAVDPDAFVPVPGDPALASALGVDGLTVIGYAGAMVRYEGLDVLADALDILAESRRDFALVALGDGPERAALVARAATSSYVMVLPGRLPHSEVARHLALADICPFPRRSLPITEAVSPMKPFEAMALGKSVVVSGVSALREIVADGQTGLVVAPDEAGALASAIGRLLDNAALRASLGAAGREWVTAEATWPARARIIGAVYDSLGAPASS